jgi:phage RecT family recombinase
MEEVGLDPKTIKKEVGFAVQQVQSSKQLQKCDTVSILKGIINVAYMGLSLNPTINESYLVPRWNKSKGLLEATLMPSYVGLMKLACAASDIRTFICNVVYTNDDFQINLAGEDPVSHIPGKDGRGEIDSVYSIAVHNDGTKQVEYLTRKDLDAIRGKSDSYQAYLDKKVKSCVWVEWEAEMCRKSCIKRQVKYLPKKNKDYADQLGTAIEIDNTEYGISFNQAGYIESLLETASIPEEVIGKIESELSHYSFDEAKECISMLKDNQIDPLQRGNMSAKETNGLVLEALNDPRK